MESWEEGGKVVDTQQVTFGKIGDFIKGTYTGKKMVKANDKDTLLYELKGIVGHFHTVDGKKNPIEPGVDVEAGSYYNVWGGKSVIDALFAKSKFGDMVALQLTEEQPSKTKGNAPFKVFKSMQFGKDPNYGGEDSAALDEAFPGNEEVE